MRLATIAQSKEIDELSQKVYGLTGEVLMESAGALAAREIDQAYFPELKRGMTAIVCGPGNNGGDGLVLARHLHASGHRDLSVFILAPQKAQSSLFKLQLRRTELHGIKIIDLTQDPEKIEQLKSSALAVDAVFGTGLSRDVQGEFVKLVDALNALKVPVISLDAPSGLNCDRGIVQGAAVKADMTLSFGLAKPGFFVSEGPQHLGKLRIVPIGFPHESLRGIATTHFLFNERLARRYLPSRKNTSNKSDHGKLLVIGGREGMWGAGQLASHSAYRMGVGYVTWASHVSPSEHIRETPEILTAEVGPQLLEQDFNAYALGPGLGVSEETAQLIKDLKSKARGPVVLDADALTTCVNHKLFPLPETWVLTPHAGELSRILNIEAQQIEANRFESALKAAKMTGCHVLLKGYRSVIAYKERCMVVYSGNSALAKAGTGDVLTGMIGGLLAQGLDTLQGAATACFIHGRLADEWVRIGNDKRSLVASDLKDHLPQLMGRLSGGALF